MSTYDTVQSAQSAVSWFEQLSNSQQPDPKAIEDIDWFIGRVESAKAGIYAPDRAEREPLFDAYLDELRAEKSLRDMPIKDLCDRMADLAKALT